MNILLTNDDGIFALGIAAMAKALSKLGTVYVAAPASEQSGVSQALTFRHPLLVKDVFVHGQRWGWAVEGTPADCVKVGVNFLCPEKPDIVVSGINWGQNCGTNILYSGTLGAIFEAGMYHIPGFGVSIQDDELPEFDRAADIACQIIEKICVKLREQGSRLDGCGNPEPQLFNINVSREAVKMETPEIVVCPMDTTPYATEMDGHSDAFGRACCWLVPNGRSRRPECMTDMNGIGAGKVTVTPLRLDMTYLERLEEVGSWELTASLKEHQKPEDEDFPHVPSIKARTVMNHKVKREA
ncbi:MAG: 5'/3'-nucleotidase SurE [Planctomycetaceae bacterium]|nr:5'/3'-nucleotidase SurE [Planctomycetaceae bacterium]